MKYTSVFSILKANFQLFTIYRNLQKFYIKNKLCKKLVDHLNMKNNNDKLVMSTWALSKCIL